MFQLEACERTHQPRAQTALLPEKTAERTQSRVGGAAKVRLQLRHNRKVFLSNRIRETRQKTSTTKLCDIGYSELARVKASHVLCPESKSGLSLLTLQQGLGIRAFAHPNLSLPCNASSG